jgi:hypothetical protein
MPVEWNDDEALLHDLTAALEESRSVPADVRRTGRALFAWRDVDAELAELVEDAAATGSGPVLLRDDGTPTRSLTFSGAGLTLDVDVATDPPALRGQVSADGEVPVPAEVVVEVVDAEPAVVPLDELGYFAHTPSAPLRPFRLRCGRLVTPWVT